MKRISFLLAGVALLLLAACSDMPTVVESADTFGIEMCQGGREVDSLLVDIMTIFTVVVPSGTTPVSYCWVFGDSTPAVYTGFAQVEHRYTEVGTYLVMVEVTYSNGHTITYSRSIVVYRLSVPPVDDILILLSSHQEPSGKWTYRLGLDTSAYNDGIGTNPFITGEPGGVIITNPVNNTNYNWVQLVDNQNQQDGRLIIEVTCWNQDDVFLNYGGNFIYGAPPAQWNWADIRESTYFVAENGGGNLHFSLVDGQLLPVNGGSYQLPGLLGDDIPATIRLTVGIDSLKIFCNLDRLQNFEGNAWLEFVAPSGDYNRQPLASSFFSGWAEVVLPLSALANEPVKIRYGHHDNDLADMAGSKYWVASDGWLEFYIVQIGSGGGWDIFSL